MLPNTLLKYRSKASFTGRLIPGWLLLVCLSLTALPLRGQQSLPLGTWLESEAPLTFHELDAQYRAWAKGRDLSGISGLKPFLRWRWMQRSRVDSLGHPITTAHYDAARSYLAQQRRMHKTSEGSWLPVGPVGALNTYERSIERTSRGRINHVCFHPTDSNTFWIAASNGGVWRTTNGGTNWSPLSDSLTYTRAMHISVDPNDPDTLFVATGDYTRWYNQRPRGGHLTNTGFGLIRSYDGGLSWQPTGLTEAYLCASHLHPDSSGTVVAAGFRGVFRSNDYGETWQRPREMINQTVVDFRQDPQNPSTLYALTLLPEGRLYKSTDFGASWTALEVELSGWGEAIGAMMAIAPSNPDVLYVVQCDWEGNDFLALHRSSDGGDTWETPATQDNTVNIMGRYDGTAEYEDDENGQGFYSLGLFVDPKDPDRVFTGSIILWGSNDGGQNWSPLTANKTIFGNTLHVDPHWMAHNPLDDKIYFCHDGGIDWTYDLKLGDLEQMRACTGNDLESITWVGDCYQLPTEWRSVSDELFITEFYRIGLCDSEPEIVVGGTQDNANFYRKPDGSWYMLIGQDGMETLVHPTNPDIVYMAIQNGELFKSVEGGRNHFPISEVIDGDTTQAKPWVTPLVMDPQNPETLYAGYSDLWRTSDGGATWEKLTDFAVPPGETTPPELVDIAIAPSDPNVIYIIQEKVTRFVGGSNTIISPASVWRTTDGGETWTEIVDGLPFSGFFSAITIDDENPDEAWIALAELNQGRKVFHTSNGGELWQNVSWNLPNLPVNCIVHQQGNDSDYVYIGMDVGVYYTSDALDGGTRWEPYTENLPNVIVHDLKIQYRSSELFAGTYGRGIWKAPLVVPSEVVSRETPMTGTLDCQLYPNPNAGEFTLAWEADLQNGQPVRLRVVDAVGREMHRQALTASGGVSRQQLDLTHLPPGLYFAEVRSGYRFRAIRFWIR